MFRLTPKKAISPDLCCLESLPETLASFLPSQARQAGYKEYDTTHLVPLPHSCSPGEAQTRGTEASLNHRLWAQAFHLPVPGGRM